MRIGILLLFTVCSAAQEQRVLVDRVGSTGFIQLEAESFNDLDLKQQALGYWLTQASIAINPIIFDQLSRYGLRQKRMLEMIVANPDGVNPAVYDKILAFTKLFWANRGNHNENTAQKFLPDFTYDELKQAGQGALEHGGRGTYSSEDFAKEVATVFFRSEFRTDDHR